MAIYAYFEFVMLPILVFIVILLYYSNKNSKLPWNWPIIGMSPNVLSNLHRFPDWATEILESVGGGGTLLVKGPWFTNTDLLLTSDPANVQHVMSIKFSKYPKGAEWRKRFDIFGDSLFNFDFGEWKYYRAFVKGFLNHQRFHDLMPKIFAHSMEEQLIPMLEHVSKNHEPVALNHLIGKHIFYMACAMIFGYDCTGSFQTCDSHETIFSKGIVDACEVILIRHLHPESIWRLKKWLRIGTEKRLRQAWISLHHLISGYVSANEEKLRDGGDDDINFNLLKLLSLKEDVVIPTSSSLDKIRKNGSLAIMLAVHDTTSTTLDWFFWILSKHPIVVKRIREEIETHFPGDWERKWVPFDAQELNQMVYLHATLCETLRLYPPVPFETRTALHNDTLPSGHKINQGARIVMCPYAMGRMTSIWGEDCHEFKPERWINDQGGIIHEPAHKFFAFNSGPRICLGKDLAFTWMKAIASTIFHNYDVQVVNHHQIKPTRPSIMLHMNHDLMVTLKKRWA